MESMLIQIKSAMIKIKSLLVSSSLNNVFPQMQQSMYFYYSVVFYVGKITCFLSDLQLIVTFECTYDGQKHCCCLMKNSMVVFCD